MANVRPLYMDATKAAPTSVLDADTILVGGIVQNANDNAVAAPAIGVYTDDTTTAITIGGGASQTTTTLGKAGQITTNLGSLTVDQDLLVSGTTTTLDTTNLSVSDDLIILRGGSSGVASNEAGIAFERGTTSANDAIILWNEAGTQFELGLFATTNGTVAPTGALTTYSDLKLNNLFLDSTAITADGAVTVTATAADLGLAATGANNVNLITNGSTRFSVNGSGHLVAGADNAYDIGTGATDSPRTVRADTSVIVATGGTSAVTITDGNVTGAAALTVAATSTNTVTLTGFSTSYGLNAGATALTTTAQTIIEAINEVDAAAAGAPTLAATLLVGNTTGASNIVVSTGQSIVGAAELTLVSTTTSAVTIDSGTTGTINIGVDGTNAKTLNLDSGTTGALNIATSAFVKTVTIGNTTGASSTVIDVGTGNLDLGVSATAHEVRIGSATGASGITMNIGTGGIDIGTNAIAAEVTIGNTTGASGITTNTGTGGFDLNTGGVLSIDAEDNSTINVAGNLTGLLDETQTADSGTAGNAFLFTSGIGAAGGGTTAGGTGGATTLVAGAGGAGSGTQSSGVGGDACIRGGSQGADGGGGLGNHGRVCFTSGNREYFLTAASTSTAPLLTTTAQTIIEAINENQSAIAGSNDLQEAYTASSAPSTITTNATNDEFTVAGTAGFRVTATGADNVSDPGFGFAVDTTGAYKLFADVASELRTTAANLTLTTETSGALTLTSAGIIDIDGVGAVSINSSAAAINIGNDAVAQAINVGTGAAARTITIGNNTGATTLALEAGTGGLDIDADGASTWAFAGDVTATHDAEAANTAGHDFSWTSGAGGVTTGAGAAGAGGQVLLTTGAGGASTGTLAGDGGAGGAFAILGGVGGVGNATDAASDGGVGGAVNITAGIGGAAANASANDGEGGVITIAAGAAGTGAGVDAAGGAVIIRGGAGGATANDGDISIGDTNTHDISIGNTTDAHSIAFATDSTPDATSLITFQSQGAASAVPMQEADDADGLLINAAFTAVSIIGAINENRANIAASGNSLQLAYEAGNTIGMTDAFGNFSVSNASGTNAITLDANEASNFTVASANLTLSTTTSGALDVTSAGLIDIDAVGVLSLNSSAAAINIGNDAVAQAINIGTGAAARTITIGNATGATTLDLDAGTGGFDLDTTGVIAMNATGTGASNLTSGGNLTLAAGGISGTLALTSPGAITISNAAGSTITVTAQSSLALNSTTGGTNIDAGSDSTVNVAGDWTVLLDETQTADSGTVGNAYALTAGIGAAAGGTTAGGVGGGVEIAAGAGGAGSATDLGGVGGDACIRAGVQGATGGAGVQDHGRVCFTSGSTEYFLTAAATTAAPALTTTAQTIIEAINEVAAATAGASEGIEVTLTAGAGGITANRGVYISANNTVLHSDASADATARYFGIAPSAITAAATGVIKMGGVVSAFFSAGLTAIAANEQVWLSETAGEFTNVAPTTSGSVRQLVGYIKDAAAYNNGAGSAHEIVMVRGERFINP